MARDSLEEKILSICIPTYNRKASLRRLLSRIISYSKKVPFKVEACISDNASTDGTFEYLKQVRRASKMDIWITRNKTNLGFDGNLLNAIGLARGRWIWLCGDDDIILEKGFAQTLRKLDGMDDPGCFLVMVGSTFSKTDRVRVEGRVISSKSLLASTPTFMSELILRTSDVKRVLLAYRGLTAECAGSHVIHAWLIRLICFDSPDLHGVRLPLVGVLTRLSSDYVKDANLQIRFMAEQLKYRVLTLLLVLSSPLGRAWYLPHASAAIIGMYLHATFNMVIARSFRGIIIDRGMIRFFLGRFRLWSPFFILPYALICLLPRWLSIAAYNVIVPIAIASGLESKESTANSKLRWREKR